MNNRSRLLQHKFTTQEHELRIISNPFENSREYLRQNTDYQAPITAYTLSPNSKWIIVRNNIHKIRSWRSIDTSKIDDRFKDWYLFFQMRRELRRAKENIKQIESRSDFSPVHYFNLPMRPNIAKRYDVSHVQPSDALYYPGLGREPIALQSLLYYFSKECAVPYESIFRPFLSDVCTIIHRNQQQRQRVKVFRQVALALTITVFIILVLMLASMLASALTTTSNLANMYRDDIDGGIEWRNKF